MYVCACVRVCACVCARARERARECVNMFLRVYVGVCACIISQRKIVEITEGYSKRERKRGERET